MDESLSAAVAAFREFRDLDDIDMYRRFVGMGAEPRFAARLVEFVPMAYGRLLLSPSRVRFSDSFQRRLSDGNVSEPRPLTSEPVWNAALEFASREVKSGLSVDDFLFLAARSAEFQGVNQMLNQGSKLENIACTSPLLPWPDPGPSVPR